MNNHDEMKSIKTNIKWSEITFGAHKGRTFPQVAFKNPNYLFWIATNGDFRWQNERLKKEAQVVAIRASRIKIPEHYGDDAIAALEKGHRDGKFRSLSVYPSRVDGPYDIFTLIDMRIPWQLCPSDKTGERLLIRQLRGILFGRKTKLTKALCEGFFSDANNFFRLDGPAQCTL